MRNFFIELFEDMKLLTNIDQGTKLKTDGIMKLSEWMAEESGKWGIDKEIQKKLIRERMIDDAKFTGLSVAFVRQVLSGYWNNNLTMRQQEVSKTHKILTPEELKQREIYENQLIQKRKENPDYDPVKEFYLNLQSVGKPEEKHQRHTKSTGGSLHTEYMNTVSGQISALKAKIIFQEGILLENPEKELDSRKLIKHWDEEIIKLQEK